MATADRIALALLVVWSATVARSAESATMAGSANAGPNPTAAWSAKAAASATHARIATLSRSAKAGPRPTAAWSAKAAASATDARIATLSRSAKAAASATDARIATLTRSAKALAERRAPAQSPTYGLGRAARPEEIKAIDIDVRPDGAGLPDGSGTAAAGKQIYATRCVTCHGATGKEGPQDILVGGQGSLATAKPLKTVGSYWPHPTTIFDYVRRAMPFDHPGTLPANDIYAVTAYVLFLNGIVGEHDVIDRTTLPKVKMPNRNGFVGDPRPDVGKPLQKPKKQ